MFELEVVGGGRMGESLVAGILDGGLIPPDEVVIVEISQQRREQLQAKFPGVTVSDVLAPALSVVLATKPSDAVNALTEIASMKPLRVVSIAAGVPLEVLEACLGPSIPAIRAMPNTPALIGEGAAAIAAGSAASNEDTAWAESIFDAVGTVVRLPESQLDAVTGLSGSGPAYVFLLAEAMIEAGVLQGLSRQVSTELTLQTVIGAARLMVDSDALPGDLRAAVTSPGGTTAAALLEFERAGFRAAVLDAIAAATDRAGEMRAIEIERLSTVTSAAEFR